MLLHCSCSCSDADAPTEVKKGGDPAPASACGSSSWVRKSRETHILRPRFTPVLLLLFASARRRCVACSLYSTTPTPMPARRHCFTWLVCWVKVNPPRPVCQTLLTRVHVRASAVPVFFFFFIKKRLGSVQRYSKFLLQTNKQTKGQQKKKIHGARVRARRASRMVGRRIVAGLSVYLIGYNGYYYLPPPTCPVGLAGCTCWAGPGPGPGDGLYPPRFLAVPNELNGTVNPLRHSNDQPEPPPPPTGTGTGTGKLPPPAILTAARARWSSTSARDSTRLDCSFRLDLQAGEATFPSPSILCIFARPPGP